MNALCGAGKRAGVLFKRVRFGWVEVRREVMRGDAKTVAAFVFGMLWGDCFAGPFREASLGVYENGAVRIEAKQRTVSFPAKLNQEAGALEYGIVTPSGSVHESLLVAEVDPVELHAAFLLLGVKPAVSQAGSEPQGLNAESLALAPELVGVPIEVRLRWEIAGRQRQGFLEDWIRYKPEASAAASGPWTYTGSYLAGGHFAAASEGALLCLVTNAAALMNNPRRGNRNDHAWEVYAEKVPPQGTDVRVEVAVLNVKVSTP